MRWRDPARFDETISVTVFRPIAAALDDAGIDWQELLRHVGIDPDSLTDCEARVPHARFAGFWSHAARSLGDPLIGLHVAERVRPHAANLIGYLLMSSATVVEGVERVARYQRVVFGTEFLRIARGPGVEHLEIVPGEAGDEAIEIRTEYMAGVAMKYVEWVTERDSRPTRACFAHPRRGPDHDYRRALGCPAEFRARWSGLTVPRAHLDLPSVHANEEMARLLQDYAERQLIERRDRTLGYRVRKLIGATLDAGDVELATVAERLRMSPRTVQRRLAAEGTSFKDLVSQMRRETALVLLEEGKVPLAEIAYVSGFSDPSNFSRAVRRWTGHSPREYRRRAASGRPHRQASPAA